jgi:hypothetical protein
MYTLLDSVHFIWNFFFAYVEMSELFEVAELGGTLCIFICFRCPENMCWKHYN